MLRAVAAEPHSKSDGHHHCRDAPAQRIVQPHQLLVVKHPDDEDVEVNALHQLPGEGAEKEVVEEDSDGGAHSVRTGHQCPIHAHQEQNVSQTQGNGQLPVDGV